MEKLNHHTRGALRQMQRREKDKRRYVKITTVLMLDAGFSAAETAIALGVDESTVHRLVADFEQTVEGEDLEKYLQDNYAPYQGRLSNDHLKILASELSENLYQTSAHVATFIDKSFGVEYSESAIPPLMKRLGFVYKKTRLVPAGADRAAQEEFLQEFEQLLKGLKPRDSIYFCDAVHPQHNTKSSYGWIQSGQTFEIPSNSGRYRMNIHGAINAQDVSGVVIREDQRINGESVIGLFEQLQSHQSTGTIYVICDNAKYYRGQKVQQWLKGSRVKQIFLPSYAPNLNLIERLWKFMRKEVINTHYYPKKEQFREAIHTFFTNIKNFRNELETLMTLNFQLI